MPVVENVVPTSTVTPAQAPPKADEAKKETVVAAPAPVVAAAEVKAEAKKEEVSKAPDAAKATPAPAPAVVEESYDVVLSKDTKIKPEELDVVKAFAKENKFSKDQAQGVATFIEKQREQIRAQVDGAWLDECKNHPTHGKENFPKSCENIKRFLERTAPKLMPLLNESGYANKVEVFEFLADLAGKGMDDSLVQGKQTVQEDKRSAMQRLEDDINKSLGVKKT
jgi:hypothetical protein